MSATPSDLVGRTVHLLRGSRYAGAFHVDEIRANGTDGWFHVVDGRVQSGATRIEDVFPTEGEARAAARTRRKPPTRRERPALYGDFALLAAFNGIATDGSGRYLGHGH